MEAFNSSVCFFFIIFFSFCYSTSNPIIFDAFTKDSFVSASYGHNYMTRITDDSSIWGFERDQIVYIPPNSSSNSSVTCTIANGSMTLEIDSIISSSGTTLQYDGLDNSVKFTNSSLSPQDLTFGDALGLELHVITDGYSSSLISVYSGSNVCYYKFNISPESTKYYSDFRLFKDSHGLAVCDFSKILGVALDLSFNQVSILSISLFGTFVNGEVPSRIDNLIIPSYIHVPVTNSISNTQYFTNSSICCVDSIVGGQRDLYLRIDVANDNSFVTSQIESGLFESVTSYGLESIIVLQYDGSDESYALELNGLGGLDFTNNGNRDTFLLQYNTNQTISITMEVYSSGIIGSSIVTAQASLTEVVFSFDSFIPLVDFTNVGSLQIFFQLTELTNITIWNISLVNQADLK